ncbi:DUF5956 family protein [Micromonospora fluostatini]|uniref:DUF5956 family protein n=1 Tax=Micromonospora sp. JCM 30529 TaxID=3421643 RepID=UPI003D1866BA
MDGYEEASAAGWDDVALSPTAPTGPAGEYLELPESGWGALVGWTVGPARLVRCPDRPEDHTTVITTISPAGDDHQARPRTAAEQTDLDADINTYLHDAGLPARPPGYRWFLRLPAGHDEDRFWNAVHESLNREQPTATHPADIARQVRTILQEIYGDTRR